MKKILIFGSSGGFEMLKEYIDFKKVKIIGFLDNNVKLQNEIIDSIKIYKPEYALQLKFDYIVTSSITHQSEMLNQLIEMGIEYKKIILPAFLYRKTIGQKILSEYNQYHKEIAVFKDDYINKEMNYGLSTMNRKLAESTINYYNYPDYLLKGLDYVRLTTVDLLSREINYNNIGGAIAELGVYKGDFSKYLGDLFPTREIILFDTFEGFSEKDIEVEGLNNFSEAEIGALSDTSVQVVLGKMLSRNRVKIRKGYFPETTKGIEKIEYAFVSIDVDLYQPILSGLNYFYERLAIGGYIIVHDYNFPTYSGVKAAVKEFTKQTGIYGVPIPDYHGSILFVKNKR